KACLSWADRTLPGRTVDLTRAASRSMPVDFYPPVPFIKGKLGHRRCFVVEGVPGEVVLDISIAIGTRRPCRTLRPRHALPASLTSRALRPRHALRPGRPSGT